MADFAIVWRFLCPSMLYQVIIVSCIRVRMYAAREKPVNSKKKKVHRHSYSSRSSSVKVIEFIFESVLENQSK